MICQNMLKKMKVLKGAKNYWLPKSWALMKFWAKKNWVQTMFGVKTLWSQDSIKYRVEKCLG